MSATSDTRSGLPASLGEAVQLLLTDPARSEELARAFLATSPNEPSARLILTAALRNQGNFAAALEMANTLAQNYPNWPGVQFELGLALTGMGRNRDALAALSRAEQLAPELPGLWRAMGDAYFAIGDRQSADQAYLRHVSIQPQEPALQQGWTGLTGGNLPLAEDRLKAHLAKYPTDVLALRGISEVCARTNRYAEAERYLVLCLDRVPSFVTARHGLAQVLFHQNKAPEALSEIDKLLQEEPRNPKYRNLRATIFNVLGDFDTAIEIYEPLLKDQPEDASLWLSYGHALRTVGRREDAIAAYRRCIELKPDMGEAYWGLANLKTFKFGTTDIDAMRSQIARLELSGSDRVPMLFALGKALEDGARYEEAFDSYLKGNSIWRMTTGYNAEETTSFVQRSRRLLNSEFFAERAGSGAQEADPIFIVGMPRSGSTLVEQILSSHSAVEGTMELTDILMISDRLGGEGRGPLSRYPEALRDVSKGDFKTLGEEFLERTRIYRKLGRAHFIDKMPNNFLHSGLIHLILPNARIIDVRRNPLACCVSNFKQHFATGQQFAYGLDDLGRYYADYVELMAHYDRALPGRIHRVIYEDLVSDPEKEIRRLLSACGLPFEEQCLRFYDTERAVRTPSSEQVRQPIFKDGVNSWRHYEPWLEPLKTALGAVLDTYPDAPPPRPI